MTLPNIHLCNRRAQITVLFTTYILMLGVNLLDYYHIIYGAPILVVLIGLFIFFVPSALKTVQVVPVKPPPKSGDVAISSPPPPPPPAAPAGLGPLQPAGTQPVYAFVNTQTMYANPSVSLPLLPTIHPYGTDSGNYSHSHLSHASRSVIAPSGEQKTITNVPGGFSISGH
ncbi:hypothetical protein BDF19DRAFT_428942 [Syncephalis fuscata]|nr:hypothetical protein BDF19DRAFT_428942 [Syncephalis fuscata]